MPLQNRVMPTGQIVADPGRGLMMGNRGCLHGPGRQLGVSRWRSQAWICCVLEWRGRRRDPMPPGRWTALFFLDEATALAAGHRPCGFCRRPDFLDFAEAWRQARRLDRRPGRAGDGRGAAPRAGRPHAASAHPPRTRRRAARWRHDPGRRGAGLWLAGRVWPWSFGGYGAPEAGSVPGMVEVLTPPSTVAAIAAGYRPLVHPSALTAPPLGAQVPRGVRAYP